MSEPSPRAPFDDIRALLAAMPGPDETAVEAVKARESTLVKPVGTLGRLETIVEWMAAWQGKAPPTVDRPVVAVYTGKHGVAAQGVSAHPANATRKMVDAAAAGGAAINQICLTFGLGLKAFDLALDLPTGDITREVALSERDCAATMAFGMEALAGGVDLLCLGEMGVGGTTSAAAIYHALYGGTAADWVNPGKGHDEVGLGRKRAMVAVAVTLHAAEMTDPLQILRHVGGREIAAMAGAILAARIHRVPVIVGGFVPTAAAAILHALNPRALDHCLFGQETPGSAHGAALAKLGQKPLLTLGIGLGEGVGAALAAGIVKAAVAVHTGMATTEQVGG